ncbi:endonuclease NucS domain-containing protein [Neomegalonema perideroedes]|uniref:endonuclease NucS domain-containing protein n=1 Tax=Neomegalonema perideroedes TaxID=217219 RepID=UPI001969F2E2|nr:endonuclease NucS domain-containing protein [Neomegalonema perideroedes]
MAPVEAADSAETEQTFSMERDLQAALRRSIAQLEPGLTIVDGGAERSVASGRIDILARDASGALVVIELKAVKAPRDAVAQILAYMGDLQEEEGGALRGILVAPDYDARAVSAARMVPALKLVTYGFSFSFTPLG